jgi:hypothetical protein
MAIRKTLTSIVLAGALALGGTGCSNKPDELLYDGEIDGQRIVYFNGDINSPDRMEIYSNGQLQKVIEDYDENGEIGNLAKDKYILVLGEDKQITYARDFIVDENGVKFQGNDEVSKKALEIGQQRLQDATTIYQDLKTKIYQKLEENLK